MSWSPTLLLLGLQIGTRLFTFALNQVLIRFSDPSIYGAAYIHLELLLSVVLFLSREGIRAAFLRQDNGINTGNKPQEALKRTNANLSLIPIPLGIALASIALPIFRRSSPELIARPFFQEVITLYLLSSLLELLAEPLYLHALSPQGGRDIALRVRAEGVAAVAKGFVTLASTLALDTTAGLLAFGIGQVCYGAGVLLTFLVVYSHRYGVRRVLSLYLPDFLGKASHGSSETTKLALSLSLQSVFKHFLTEVDKLAVSRLASLEDQGGYALGTNYASLPLRLLFQPLEESSRFQFSKDLGSISTREAEMSSVSSPKQQKGFERKQPDSSLNNEKYNHALQLLSSLLRLHTFLGALLLAFLPPLARPFILVLSGSQWVNTSAPRTLAAYAIFLPTLGWSGILEGFLQSTASQSQLRSYNLVIVASSVTFGASLWILTGPAQQVFGVSIEEALVYASALSMSVRAVSGANYASRLLRGPSLRRLGPSRQSCMAILLAAMSLRAVASRVERQDPKDLRSYGPLIGCAVSCGLGSLAVLWVCDRASLITAVVALRSNRDDRDDGGKRS